MLPKASHATQRLSWTSLLLDLAGELAPGFLADLLGMHPGSPVRWDGAAGGDWSSCTGARSSSDVDPVGAGSQSERIADRVVADEYEAVIAQIVLYKRSGHTNEEPCATASEDKPAKTLLTRIRCTTSGRGRTYARQIG